MATVAISDTPAQLTGFLTEPGLITNSGEQTIYLGDNGNVSDTDYGIRLFKNQTVNFSVKQVLYAVCSSGERSTAALLYGSNNSVSTQTTTEITGPVTVEGTVNATVTGDVNATIDGPVEISSGQVNVGTVSGDITVGGILTPVRVQGGGESLSEGFIILPSSGATYYIDIPLPASGVEWPSYFLEIVSTNEGLFTYQLEDQGQDVLLAKGSGAGPSSLYTQFTSFNTPSYGVCGVSAVVPALSSNYPLLLSIKGDGMAAIGVQYRVYGTSILTAKKFSDTSHFSAVAPVVPSAGITEILLPPSFTPYRVGLTNTNTLTLTNNTRVDSYVEGAFVAGARRVFASEVGSGNAFTRPAAEYSQWVTSGSGYLEKLVIDSNATYMLYLRSIP